MSKCQKNKYFNVGCQPCKTTSDTSGFQSSLSKMLADREKQDSMLNTPITQSINHPTKHPTKHSTAITVVPKKAPTMSDIDIILSGDTD